MASSFLMARMSALILLLMMGAFVVVSAQDTEAPGAGLEEACNTTEECGVENSVCEGSMCVCMSGYQAADNICKKMGNDTDGGDRGHGASPEPTAETGSSVPHGMTTAEAGATTMMPPGPTGTGVMPTASKENATEAGESDAEKIGGSTSLLIFLLCWSPLWLLQVT